MAIIGAAAAIIRDRRKPQLDLANRDQVQSVVKEYADKSNARRDLRLLQIENWAFNQVRPWGRDTVVKFDRQSDLLHDMAAKLQIEVPVIHLLEFPEMPPPLLPE